MIAVVFESFCSHMQVDKGKKNQYPAYGYASVEGNKHPRNVCAQLVHLFSCSSISIYGDQSLLFRWKGANVDSLLKAYLLKIGRTKGHFTLAGHAELRGSEAQARGVRPGSGFRSSGINPVEMHIHTQTHNHKVMDIQRSTHGHDKTVEAEVFCSPVHMYNTTKYI